MSYHAYTVLECTNPSLISSGSTFAKESNSELLKIEHNKSHFLTWNSTMNSELIGLSLKFPEETFTSYCHRDHEFYNRIIYSFEFKKGKCSELGIEPEYMFFLPAKTKHNDEHYKAFRNHVLEYLTRLDIVKEVQGGFELDKLGNEKDEYGFESHITITYENDQYRWTAERTGISYIRVLVEKKEPRKIKFKEITDITDLLGCDDDGLPS